MVKIICDVCEEEISSGKYQEIKAYSMSVYSVEGGSRGSEEGSPQYFLTLKQVHLEYAKEVERVVKEAMKEYLSNFSAGGKS